MNPRLLKPTASAFSPRSISGLALWLDASDGATLFQNSDGTVPATASSDPVGYWADKSGNGRHAVQATAGSRPLLTSTFKTNKQAVRFTASTQALNLAATWSDLGNNTEKTITEFYVLQWPTGSNQAFVQEPGAFDGHKTFAYFSNSQSYYDAGGSSTARVFGNVGSAITGGVVITALRNGGTVTLFHGETQVATRSDATGNIYGGSAANTVSFVGASGGDAFLASSVVYSRALSVADQRRVRNFLSARHGIPIPPTVANADAQDWIDRVYQNGGTVSSATAAAVNTFCESIASAGIRDRFYRLGIFAGSNLNAALVPLYRGPSLGGTQYGGTTDTNNAFVGVGTDYAETGASGGLLGNGTTKYLNTAFNVDQLAGAANCHLSSFITGTQDIASARTLVGVLFNGVTDRYRLFLQLAGSTAPNYGIQTELGQANSAFSANRTNTNGGLILASRTSTTLLTLYDDAVSIGTTETSTAETTGASPFFVFARNGPTEYYNGRMAAYSIGAGMTADQVTAYNTAIQAFQTAMGRA
jgi:hypothetical protein